MTRYSLLLLLILSLPAQARQSREGGNGGDLVGNGGDGQVIEFRNLALDAAEKLRQINGSCQSLLPLKPLDLIKVIYRARIESSEQELSLGGRRVEAINYPAQTRIVFHSPSFVANRNKKQFVIHEFLGLLGIADARNDEEYGMSKFLVELGERPECQSPVSKRLWQKKKLVGETVYFEFHYPKEILAYDLARQEQLPALPFPGGASTFDRWNDEFYYGFAQQVCTAGDPARCLPQSKVSLVLHDFAIHGDRLLESVMGVRSAEDFFETRYDYDNLRIASLRGAGAYSVRLETPTSNDNLEPGGKYRYSLPRGFLRLNATKSLAIADQYSGDQLTAFSLVLLEWLDNPNPPSRPFTNSSRFDGGAMIDVHGPVDRLHIVQRFLFASTNSVPQEAFGARNGSFVLLGDGTVYETAGLRKVAVLEAPVEDVAEYGDYVIVLSAGRILTYDQRWHLQGEFNPAVSPQGLAVRGDTISLFSMLTDQKLFVQNHDVSDFFKKKRSCLMSREKLAAFHPAATITHEGATYALAAGDGCVVKMGHDGKWQAWMGMLKNPAAVLQFPGTVVVADRQATLYTLDLPNRDESMIAKLNAEVRKAEVKDGKVELVLHTPGMTDDFLRRVVLTPEGRILSDSYFWNR